MNTMRALIVALAAAGCLTLVHAQGLRPEIGKPLQQAGELLKAGKAREAMGKVREAEAVSGKTASEQLMIDRMEAAVAQRAGDNATAVRALEAVFPKVSGAEAGQTAEALAFGYSQLRNWAKSEDWANKAKQLGRDTPQLRQLVQYLQSQSGDYAAIARDSAAAVAGAEKAGRVPDEGELLRLADAQQRLKNTAGYIDTLEKLLAYHPKKDYWAAYLSRLPRRSGFSSRLSLDLMRLRLASGTLDTTDEYFEMAQLAMQAGFPTEGLKIIEKGYASGVLGTGPQADRHQRLRDLAVKREADRKASLAKDVAEAEASPKGESLVDLGYVYVTMGDVERGVKLMEQGIAKGGLKRPEDAKLHLGMAELNSPKRKAQGLRTLRSLKGSDGVAEIGRLWAVLGHP